jgi:hypothetical protein
MCLVKLTINLKFQNNCFVLFVVSRKLQKNVSDGTCNFKAKIKYFLQRLLYFFHKKYIFDVILELQVNVFEET